MQQLSLIGGCRNRLLRFNKVVYSREESEYSAFRHLSSMENSRDAQNRGDSLILSWQGFEYTARRFEHSVVVIHGTAHLTDEPHSVRGNDAITNNLILKRNQDGMPLSDRQ